MEPKTNTKSAMSLHDSVEIMTILMSVWRHLLVRTRDVWKTSTMTYLARQWASLYMLRLLILKGIFERTVRPWFVEAFRCHCHLQCQICFGLGDGQDTEGFLNIGVSLGCFHYSYTKIFSQMTSGGDLCHLGTSKLIIVTNQ